MFPKKQINLKSGFSLPELLVAIAIIGTLSTIAILSVNSVRATARDVKRVADLQAIEAALQLYHNKYGTYKVAGAGWMGCGCGYTSDNAGGFNTVIQGLNLEGFLPVSVLDDPKSQPGYMLYLCDANQSYSLSATKENPTAKDIASIKNMCNGSNVPVGNGNAIDTRYGKNFGVANKTY